MASGVLSARGASRCGEQTPFSRQQPLKAKAADGVSETSPLHLRPCHSAFKSSLPNQSVSVSDSHHWPVWNNTVLQNSGQFCSLGRAKSCSSILTPLQHSRRASLVSRSTFVVPPGSSSLLPAASLRWSSEQESIANIRKRRLLLGEGVLQGSPLFRKHQRRIRQRARGSALGCSCSLDLAANLFTIGTAMVVPFYTLMLAAPKWQLTRKVMDSAIPYVILGAMYIYLLSISWTPEHPKLMFSSKYWLPELSGITRMFSSMLTVSSAWIHLLAVDLFAGRNIYLDSVTHNLPCRHSLVLCLMFGPVGIFSHLFTKNLVMAWRKATRTEKDNQAPEAGPVNVFPNEPFAGLTPHEATPAS